MTVILKHILRAEKAAPASLIKVFITYFPSFILCQTINCREISLKIQNKNSQSLSKYMCMCTYEN